MAAKMTDNRGKPLPDDHPLKGTNIIIGGPSSFNPKGLLEAKNPDPAAPENLSDEQVALGRSMTEEYGNRARVLGDEPPPQRRRSMLGDFITRALMGAVPLTVWIGGLWVLMAEMGWLADKIGWFWAGACLLIAPVVLVATPLAAGLVDGQWAYLWLSLTTLGLAFAGQILLTLTLTLQGRVPS
jgi:hypothetical protein